MSRPIAAILFVFALAVPAAAYVIDRVEAVVDGSPITKSEVDRALEEAKRASGGKEPDPASLRGAVLNSLIDRRLLLAEARKFNLVQVTDKEVQEAFDSVKSRYRSKEEFEAALAQDEMTQDELKENLRDQLLALKYVDRRVKYFVRVTLDEQRKYYDQNKDAFGAKSFGDVQEQIYDLLVEKKTTEKLDDYIKELRSKSRITVHGQP
jgi:parvulin-like peptidyl-prolyl isomerase